MTNGRRKSDSPIVPGKPANKAWGQAAELVEERGLTKGNPLEQNALRTQSRTGAPNALERIREIARRNKKQRFTALLHHVYDVGRLRRAYFALKRNASAGVDGETWRTYGEDLEARLQDLSARLRRGAYRAKPVRRAFIPKSDGRRRPLGVPVLEDKIVQRSVVEVLNAIYETDFLGFSYGFRPGRCQHDALTALTVGIQVRKVGWVLDADLQGFFDTLDHAWLVKFLEHRIGDQRVIRLIQKWLKAGVLEEGKRIRSETGTVQGGSISPLLANLYLHYVLDLWVQKWRRQQGLGEVIIVRFADDFVLGFRYRRDAVAFLAALRARMAQFGLALHPEKTRMIQFGRFAIQGRRDRGFKKPETFNFLGFTHICSKTRKGKFMVLRKTIRSRRQAKLREIKAELRRRMHEPIPVQGAYLRSVVAGHIRYFGVPSNGPAIGSFRREVGRIWLRQLRRRSQKHRLTWERMQRLIDRWLPPARICHPHPLLPWHVITRGRSPVR